MLGWIISIYRKKSRLTLPATAKSVQGEQLATWQSGLWGLQWMDELVESGKGIQLQRGGYPNLYTGRSKDILPRISDPPDVHTSWFCGPYDLAGDGWEGRTVIDATAIARCSPDEWLIIQAWDES
jgi:hypothetical protein